jgi:hypothetical protein
MQNFLPGQPAVTGYTEHAISVHQERTKHRIEKGRSIMFLVLCLGGLQLQFDFVDRCQRFFNLLLRGVAQCFVRPTRL